MNAPERTRLRGALEGFAAGLAMGIFVVLAERSTSFLHVYFDVLSPLFRMLAARIDETSLHRLDTNAVTAAITVAPCALGGAVLGALGRRGVFAVVGLAAIAAAAYASIWRHRALSLPLGLALLACATLLAGIASAVAGAALARLPARAARLGFGIALAVALGIPAFLVATALRGPSRPAAARVAAALREPTQQKVAILALDGLDGRLLDEAFREGRLPHLRALCEGGVRAPLRSIRPPRSPVVWTSVVTGALPQTHRIRDFVTRRDGQRIPVTGDLRAVPALWDLGAHVGFTTAFVNWYVSWPADVVRGAQISDRADFAGLDRRVYPPELESAVDSLRAQLDSDPRLDSARFTDFGSGYDAWRAQLWGQNRRAMKILDDVIRHDVFSVECAKLVMRDGQPELVGVYLRGTDNAQHLFWKHRESKRRPLAARALYGTIPEDESALAPVIDRYYDFVDALCGEMLAMLEPGTAILIASDHGFLTNNERGIWWNADAILEAAGLPARDDEEPSIAARRKIRGERLDEARTVFLAAKTERGDAIVRSAALATDERGQFLDVVFDRKARGDSVRIGELTVPMRRVTEPEGHSGDHRMDGVLIAAGPPFRTGGTLPGARAVDVAPTVLHLLGAPVAEDAEGVVLGDVLDPSWGNAHPVRSVETYGTREAAASTAPTPADERIREELEALGYIR